MAVVPVTRSLSPRLVPPPSEPVLPLADSSENTTLYDPVVPVGTLKEAVKVMVVPAGRVPRSQTSWVVFVQLPGPPAFQVRPEKYVAAPGAPAGVVAFRVTALMLLGPALRTV